MKTNHGANATHKEDQPLKTNTPDFLTGYPVEATAADMPDPIRFLGMIGPGVVMLATSLGSGEIYFWPGITIQHGFVLIWPALAALWMQYVLNTEFARYTLVTGESVVTGFGRLWKHLPYVFLGFATLPWLWPGWSTGGATALNWVFGWDVSAVAVLSLLLIGAALTATRAVYRTLELMEMVLTGFVLVTVILTAVVVVDGESVRALGEGLATVPTSLPEGLSLSTLLAALAFCGAGGSINLTTSLWIRDKGFGMGAKIPKIESPISGRSVAKAGGAFFPAPTSENLTKFRIWWRLVRREQLLTFFAIGGAGLILLMLIGHALLYGTGAEPGMAALAAEGEALANVTPWLGRDVFYLMVAAVFFTSALGVLDHVARLSADILKTNVEIVRNDRRWLMSESGLYFLVLWSEIAFAIGVLLIAEISSPPTLLEIAGSLSGIVMFIYSALTLVLVHRMKTSFDAAHPAFAADNPFSVPLWRKIALGFAAVFYGFFSLILIRSLLG